MEHTSHTLWRILVGLVLVVVLVSATVVAVSQHQRAGRAETRAVLAEGDRTLAEGNLTEVEITLDSTRADLARTRHRLGQVTTQATTLGQQSYACRYLVRVNDRLLSGSIAYQHAAGALLKKRPHMSAAKHWINRAHRHAVAVMALAKRAGYRNLDQLVAACAPPRR